VPVYAASGGRYSERVRSLSPFAELADGVHVAVAEPASVNIGLVVGSRAALLVDTGSHPDQGREVRAAAQAGAGGVPLAHVVVTHAHYDHLYGLAAFADLATWGHRGLAPAAAADLAREASGPGEDPTPGELGLTASDVALPSRTFGLAATVDLGDCQAELVHFGRGHTDHDVVVIVPGRGVVFAGDLLESAGPPSAGPDSWPAEWPRTLDGTLGTLRAHTRIVPGHGGALDRAGAFIQRAELAFVAAKAEQLYGRGVPAGGVWDAADDWPWGREAVESFVTRSYARLAQAGRRPGRNLPLA